MSGLEESTRKVQAELPLIANSRRRFSLAKMIAGAFTGIIVLFLLMLFMGSYRLDSFQSLIEHISEDSFPEIAHSTSIHNQVNALLYFSSHLANANNNVQLRIIKKDIDDKISTISQQLTAKNNNANLLAQLHVINTELTHLYELVKHKRALDTQITVVQNKLYVLHQPLFKLVQQIPDQFENSSPTMDWVLTYSEILALTNQVLVNHRLQDVRQTFATIEKNIVTLRNGLSSLPNAVRGSGLSLTYQLQQLLLEENGLLALKIEQLRVAGRVTGRDNFVKNLIDGFLRGTEFTAKQIIEKVIDETQTISERIATEAKLISIVSILLLFVLFLVIAFIETRFVARMTALNKNMRARLSGSEEKVTVDGNDELADMASAFNYFADKIELQKQRLHELSLTDSLTGIANRRALDQRLQHDLQTAIRCEWPVAVLLMDIDCFKNYNDSYGHVAGDACLQAVTEALGRCQKRSTDFVARYGGEEFLFLLPDTDLAGGQRVADKIKAEMAALQLVHGSSDVVNYVTLSIGITIFNPQDKVEPQQLLENADYALYKAKLSGKNCSCTYQKSVFR